MILEATIITTKSLSGDKTIPATLNRNINSFGGQYEYQKNKWKGNFLLSIITNQSLSNIDAKLNMI
jgi:menaquinone-dependent protoporphyrinogen IX oxidase